MVERYGGLAGGIVPADDGPWVRYSDYAALEAQLAEISSNATKARQAVERLANTKMDLSLSEWSELSSAILSALEPAATDAPANLADDDVDAAYQAALDNLPAEFRGEIGRGELDRMVRAIVRAHDSKWERRAKAMAHHHHSALQASIDTSKPAAPEGQQEPVAWVYRRRDGKTFVTRNNYTDWRRYYESREPLCPRPSAVTEAERDVLAERRRQIEVEGWTSEHDDQEHDTGDLAAAASAYALHAADMLNPYSQGDGRDLIPDFWPFSKKWWKPSVPRRDLVKAGALIIAEIERLDRAALKAAMEAGRHE